MAGIADLERDHIVSPSKETICRDEALFSGFAMVCPNVGVVGVRIVEKACAKVGGAPKNVDLC
jgi:hypothetical protein